jgi:hypothetical protein
MEHKQILNIVRFHRAASFQQHTLLPAGMVKVKPRKMSGRPRRYRMRTSENSMRPASGQSAGGSTASAAESVASSASSGAATPRGDVACGAEEELPRCRGLEESRRGESSEHGRWQLSPSGRICENSSTRSTALNAFSASDDSRICTETLGGAILPVTCGADGMRQVLGLRSHVSSRAH